MENFILCTVWNKDDRYLKCKLLREQISNVNEFNITEETLEKNKENEKLDCTWNGWYSKSLVELV